MKITQLMLYREIIAVCTKHTNTQIGQNVQILKVVSDVTALEVIK